MSARQPIEIVPVGLRVEGRSILVVGAGRIAARKAAAYLERRANVTVVATHHGPEMDALPVARRIVRPFEPADLDGAWLVVTATGDPRVDGAVYRAAEARRVWCNAADDPLHCSIILPAVSRAGDITVSVSTGGRSPATASWLKRRIDELLDRDTVAISEISARVRDSVRGRGLPTEVPGWAAVLDADAEALVAAGRGDELEQLLFDAVVDGSR